MRQIIDLYGLVEVVLRGLMLVSEAVTAGGIIFLCLLDPLESAGPAVTLRCRRFLRVLAVALATFALCSALLTGVVLRASTNGFRWIDTAGSSFFQANFLIAVAALLIATFSMTVPARWLLPPALAAVIGTALTSHAFARIESRSLLLFLTGVHQFAMAAWIGGLPWLLIALGRGSDQFALRAVQRFSRLALVSVPILVFSGIVLGRAYVGSMDGIYGTSYGVMLAAKVVLLGLLLLLGAVNFRLVRHSKPQTTLKQIVRRTVEVEAAVGIAVILVASSMASQPPAVDLTEGRVSLSQVTDRFTPRWPHLETPSPTALSPATPLNIEESRKFGRPLSYASLSNYTTNSAADIAWSEYNHNWIGICIIAVGVLALIAQLPRGHWARHWPLAFLGLAVFILIRADPENWPLGPRGFWESFLVPDVMQHRLAVILITALAIFEWRVTTGRTRQSWHALVFPAICMIGGALLFMHTHLLGNVAEETLAEMSHSLIAIFAIVAAGARWLQLRLPRRSTLFGFLWATSFLIIGLVLTTYREA